VTRRPRLPATLVLIAVGACNPTPNDPGTTAPVAAPEASAPEPTSEPLPSISDDPVIAAIVEEGLRRSEAEDHLRHLTRAIGPRLTSSHALMDAERWAVEEFAALGLDARLEHWGDYPVGFDRGPATGGMVSPTAVPFDFTTAAWSPGISGPARGRALAMPSSIRELESAVKTDAKSFSASWIVVPRPPEERAKRMDAETTERIEAALAEQGILGYVIADRDAAGELVHTSGRHEIEWGALPDAVRVRLRGDQHDDLLARMGKGEKVELEFSIDNRFFRGPVRQHNVVADLIGSERPDEFVIVGGHLDSWDGAEGAVDNATGVATTLEAARLLVKSGAQPRRTIRFMLWSGEEQGLFGSRAYVKEHPELLDKISAVLVHDGGTNYLGGLNVTPEMHAQLSDVLDPLTKLAPDTMPFELRLTDHLRPGSSDHDSFLAAGVPGFFWVQKGRSQYRCMHHTQLDVFEAGIDDYQRHSAVVVATGAYRIANADALVTRENALPANQRTLDCEHDWAKIEAVPKTGHARKAGLRPGDVITAVNGEPVSTSSRVRRLLNEGEPKKVLSIRRGKKRFEVTIDYTDDPAERAAADLRAKRIERFGADIFERIAADHADDEGPLGDAERSCATELGAARDRRQVP
jgi:hypothetical protein